MNGPLKKVWKQSESCEERGKAFFRQGIPLVWPLSQKQIAHLPVNIMVVFDNDNGIKMNDDIICGPDRLKFICWKPETVSVNKAIYIFGGNVPPILQIYFFLMNLFFV